MKFLDDDVEGNLHVCLVPTGILGLVPLHSCVKKDQISLSCSWIVTHAVNGNEIAFQISDDLWSRGADNHQTAACSILKDERWRGAHSSG